MYHCPSPVSISCQSHFDTYHIAVPASWPSQRETEPQPKAFLRLPIPNHDMPAQKMPLHAPDAP